jgi:hypothetical protein
VIGGPFHFSARRHSARPRRRSYRLGVQPFVALQRGVLLFRTTNGQTATANFSDGIFTNVTLTPLPSTWTMLIAGFVGLGFFCLLRDEKGLRGHRSRLTKTPECIGETAARRSYFCARKSREQGTRIGGWSKCGLSACLLHLALGACASVRGKRTSRPPPLWFTSLGVVLALDRPHLRLRKRQKGYQNHGFVAEGRKPLY